MSVESKIDELLAELIDRYYKNEETLEKLDKEEIKLSEYISITNENLVEEEKTNRENLHATILKLVKEAERVREFREKEVKNEEILNNWDELEREEAGDLFKIKCYDNISKKYTDLTGIASPINSKRIMLILNDILYDMSHKGDKITIELLKDWKENKTYEGGKAIKELYNNRVHWIKK